MTENNRILIIDDENAIRKLYKKIFASNSQQGYKISAAEDGEKGIQLVKKSIEDDLLFALAFIDMKMPGIDGAETATQIWAIDPNIKIVIATAYSEYSSTEIVELTGRSDIFYLKKPFNREEILQFARALTNEWNLEKDRDFLESCLKKANKNLEEANENLKQKVEDQAALIVQTEKMASIGILAAGVAHEINNPISFIKSNLSVVKNYFENITDLFHQYSGLEDFLDQKDMDNSVKQLNKIRDFKKEYDMDMIIQDLDELADESIDGVQRVKNIVNDLKNFSRIDEAEYKFLNINESIDTTLNILKTQLKYKVTIEKDYDENAKIKCFPQKISQVFMNLLINAGQAIEEKGFIRISTKMITMGKRASDKFIEIKISDTGAGIPKENLTKLFDPFFTTKPMGEGTGLGLSITYEIIKNHHGQITVESKVGKGTEFTIRLPAVTR